MKHIFSIVYFIISLSVVVSCKQKVKSQEDKIYSRYLQNHIPLKIISTPIPDDKSTLNLLVLFSTNDVEKLNAIKILDSLNKQKAIAPTLLITINGKSENWGLITDNATQDKKITQFNNFILNELLPYAKKKMSIRKFESVVLVGIDKAGLNAIDMGWNNNDKIKKAGLLNFSATTPLEENSFSVIESSRKRPKLDLLIMQNQADTSLRKFELMLNKKASMSLTHADINAEPNSTVFARFLVWAFPQ